MTRNEFVPGVKFKIQSICSDRLGIYTWQYLAHESSCRDDMIHIVTTSAPEHRCHIEVRRNGIRFWNYIGDVYVESELIRYNKLHIVEEKDSSIVSSGVEAAVHTTEAPAG